MDTLFADLHDLGGVRGVDALPAGDDRLPIFEDYELGLVLLGAMMPWPVDDAAELGIAGLEQGGGGGGFDGGGAAATAGACHGHQQAHPTGLTEAGMAGDPPTAFDVHLDPEEATLRIMLHPLFKRLTEVHSRLLNIGEAPPVVHPEVSDGLDAMRAVTATEEGGDGVDAFMHGYIPRLEAVAQELEDALAAAETDIARLDRELAHAVPPPRKNGETGQGTSAATPDGERLDAALRRGSALRETMRKRLDAKNVMSIANTLLSKRKSVKLPDASVATLKVWWNDNLVWPYPSDDEKQRLAKAAGLSSSQVNYWFINARKRHWVKLFPARVIPQSKAEAAATLSKQFGTLEKALQAARRL